MASPRLPRVCFGHARAGRHVVDDHVEGFPQADDVHVQLADMRAASPDLVPNFLTDLSYQESVRGRNGCPPVLVPAWPAGIADLPLRRHLSRSPSNGRPRAGGTQSASEPSVMRIAAVPIPGTLADGPKPVKSKGRSRQVRGDGARPARPPHEMAPGRIVWWRKWPPDVRTWPTPDAEGSPDAQAGVTPARRVGYWRPSLTAGECSRRRRAAASFIMAVNHWAVSARSS